uniref:Integrin subunit alpha 6 n=1 Tax=Amphiprion percula TaxID=161767 RepID=A0A3P8RXC4_AMPPE
ETIFKKTVACCFNLCVLSTTFNLDTQNVLQRSGDPGSLFGFSVAFHQQLNPARKNLLLVGAPRAKHQSQVNVTGVVYQCDLDSTSERCQPIEFDDEGINNQWMGVRVTSQGPGKNVMSCAHRYQQWSPSPSLQIPHLLTGQCYLLGDDLQVGKEDRKWRRVVCDYEHLTRRQKDQEWFAYCQQGHGASFAKDNRSLIFGGPGAYQWRGIVRMELLDNLDIFSEDPRETGDIDQFNPKLIPFQRNSYLGFSVDSGFALLNKSELTIVSGAPRGGYSGQVAFLKADPKARRNLSVELVISGPGLASSFGYDVAVVDLNGDGWEDLAVGAPQYFVKDGVVGGAVFLYVNNEGKNWEKIVPVKLVGQKDSMFGLAVENIGDIDQDGYEDIAVGAPYDGSGRVFLFYGSSGRINTNPAQILSPGSKTVNLFGYSLAGNLDVDDNQYPDLAVGSLSDSVFVFSLQKIQIFEGVAALLKLPNSVGVYLINTDIILLIRLINKGCGSDNICQSNLQLQYKFCSKKIQNGQDIFKSLAREDGDAVITPSDEDIALEITVTNRDGDDAHQSHAVITLPDTLHYSSVETQASCTANDKGTLIDCELGNPFKRDAEVTFYVLLTTSGISLSTKNVNITLQLETTSVQTIQPVEALAKVVFELELQVYGLARPSQVSLGDNVKGESAIKSLDQIGTSVEFEFRITNLGRPLKSFANASLNIYWPKENSVGKWILYLTHISSKGVQSVPCSPANEVNPLKDAPSRNRREAEHEALSTDGLTFLLSRRKYETLSCSDGLKCVEIRCPLLGLDSSALLVLHSRLWNATLAEVHHFCKMLFSHMISTSSLKYPYVYMWFLCLQVKLTVFLERKTEFLVKVAWWIILLTVIALLLLLAVFVFLLWKVTTKKGIL